MSTTEQDPRYIEGSTQPFIDADIFGALPNDLSGAGEYFAINVRARSGRQFQIVIDIEADGPDEIRVYKDVDFYDIEEPNTTISLT